VPLPTFPLWPGAVTKVPGPLSGRGVVEGLDLFRPGGSPVRGGAGVPEDAGESVTGLPEGAVAVGEPVPEGAVAVGGRFASDGSHATTAPPTAAKTANAARPPVSRPCTRPAERFRRRPPPGFRLCAVTVVHDVIAM